MHPHCWWFGLFHRYSSGTLLSAWAFSRNPCFHVSFWHAPCHSPIHTVSAPVHPLPAVECLGYEVMPLSGTEQRPAARIPAHSSLHMPEVCECTFLHLRNVHSKSWSMTQTVFHRYCVNSHPFLKYQLSACCSLCEDSKISPRHKRMGVSGVELSLVEESSSLTWLYGARGVNFRRLQTFVTEKILKCAIQK